jgi:hypothetical protein
MAVTAVEAVAHIPAGIIPGICDYLVAINHVGVIVIKKGLFE